MDPLFARIIVEHGLEPRHQLPVPGEGAGGHHNGLGPDLHISAAIVGQHAGDLSILQDQVLCRGPVEDLPAFSQQIVPQMGGHPPAAFAGADHLVDAGSRPLPLKNPLEAESHGRLAETVGRGEIMLVDHPVDEFRVGLEHPAQQLRIHVVALCHLQEPVVFLLPLVLNACGLMELGVMDPEPGGIPGGAAHLVHLLQHDDLFPLIRAFRSGDHSRGAGADHADVALTHHLVMGRGSRIRLLRV